MARFDDCVDDALAVLKRWFPDSFPEMTLVRDPSGAVTVIVPEGALGKEALSTASGMLHQALGRYSPGPRRVLLLASDLLDPQDVLASPLRVPLPGNPGVRIVDRMLTNLDWLREPKWTETPLPVGAAFSIKGGVGRSTALALLSWHFARQGRSVLVVDLDLEAPGIGGMLVRDPPAYGVVDWCAESLVGPAH